MYRGGAQGVCLYWISQEIGTRRQSKQTRGIGTHLKQGQIPFEVRGSYAGDILSIKQQLTGLPAEGAQRSSVSSNCFFEAHVQFSREITGLVIRGVQRSVCQHTCVLYILCILTYLRIVYTNIFCVLYIQMYSSILICMTHAGSSCHVPQSG